MTNNARHVWHLTLEMKDGTKREQHFVTVSQAFRAYSDAVKKFENPRSPVVALYWTEGWFYGDD